MSRFPTRKRISQNFLWLILIIFLSRCSDSDQNPSRTSNDTNKLQKEVVNANTVSSGQNPDKQKHTKRKIPVTSVQSILCGKPVIRKVREPHITSLPSAGGIGYLPMQNFNTEQGLGLSSISCCYTDRAGFIWFGTYGGGVSRFDGKSFINFSKIHGLSNNTIYCIAEDSYGNIWFGTEGQGANCYDGKSFKNYSIQQGLTRNTIRSIIKDRKGRLWFGTDNGVTMYDGEAFRDVTPPGLLRSIIKTIYEDHSGAVWFGTEGQGLGCYDGKSYTYYTAVNGLSDNSIWSLCEDNEHNLWIGTSNGISCFNGKSFTNYMLNGIISNAPVRTISKDQNGRLWFAVFDKGVVYYDGKFSNLTKLNSGLGDNKVTSLTIDHGNHIWFGTFGSGVNSFDGGSLSYYTNVNGLSGNHVRCILEDSKENLWFGTDRDGLSRFDGNTFFNYSTQDGLPNNNVWCSHEDRKGNLWFGTYGGGLCKYDGNFFNNYSIDQGLASNKILCIVEDKKGNLWFGTDTGGVICFDGSAFKTYKIAHGLPSNHIWCGMEDKKGNLWFGTFGGGLSCFNGNSFTNYSTNDGLSDNTILCIAEDRAGNIWFGTDGSGVNRYDGKNFTAYSSAQGLNNNEVYAITIGKKGEIILGTNLGISILSSFVRKEKSGGEISFSSETHYTNDALNESVPSNTLTNNELQENFNPLFEEYCQKTGYQIRDVNTNAILYDKEGTIWAGCGDGKLVRLNTLISRKGTQPPIAYIQGLKLQNEAISWSTVLAENSKRAQSDSKKERITAGAYDRSVATGSEVMEETFLFGQPLSEQQRQTMAKKYRQLDFSIDPGFSFLPHNLALPYKFNQVTFDYSAIAPSDFSTTRFQYMLKGYDKDWSPVTDKTSATFGNIYEGKYNFILRAQNRFGKWGPPIIYSFTVLPPLYRTWWALTLYILFVLLSIRLYIQWRERKLRKEKDWLEENIARQKLIDSERSKLMKDIVNRNKDLEQFSYIVSHNLRSPVANILGAAGLLQRNGIKEADEKYLMSGIVSSVNKLDDVLKDLNYILELRNNTNEKKELINFSSILYDARTSIENLFGNKDADISGDFSEIDKFFTLKSYMYSIFLNLISNSIKYSRPDVRPIIRISSRKDENRIVLVFSDNGMGIDLEAAGKKIFGLYQRFHKHTEGKGVGLYMIKTQVEALGGRISVTSDLNVGTIFTLVFEGN